MPRSFTYSALTLRVKPSGESNREAWFLTAEEGLLRATVFGGPKSRLRARVAPFHGGTLYIYHDPVRDSRKVSDFDVHSYRPGIRELYERAMAAGAVAETILSSHGGGGLWKEAANLAGNVLDAIDAADAALCSRLSVYFFWHWAEILGVRPDISALSDTGNDSYPGEESGFPVRLDPGARLWLKAIESLPAAALARVTLDAPSLEQAKAFSHAVLADALGKKLPTWDGI